MKKSDSNMKSYIIWMVSLIAFAGAVFLCGILVCASSYTVFNSDDYTTASSEIVIRNGASIRSGIELMAYFRESWGGYYSTFFFNGLLIPLERNGLVSLRRIIVFSNISFFLTVFLLFYTIVKVRKQDTRITLLYFSLFIYLLSMIDFYDEIFFWFTCATGYVIPFTFLVLGVITFIIANNKEKGNFFWYLISSTIGVVAMGGALNVSGIGCYTLVLLCLYYQFGIRVKKSQSIRNWICFTIYLLCSIVNVSAPGNYKRHCIVDDSGLHPLMAMSWSIDVYLKRLDLLFEKKQIIPIIIVLVSIGYYVSKHKDYMGDKLVYDIVMLSGVLLAPVVAIYPTILGYSTVLLPKRSLFCIDMSIFISFFYCFTRMGILIRFLTERVIKSKRINKRQFKTDNYIYVFAIIVIVLTLPITKPWNIPMRNAYIQLRTETYQTTYREYMNLYSILEKKEQGTDAYIDSKDVPRTIPYYYNVIFDEQALRIMAQYYKLNSIRIMG